MTDMTDITPQERQLRETMLPPKPYQPPTPRMVPRLDLNPGDSVTMAGAIEQLGERQEELRKALDKLIEDAVALRALM